MTAWPDSMLDCCFLPPESMAISTCLRACGDKSIVSHLTPLGL